MIACDDLSLLRKDLGLSGVYLYERCTHQPNCRALFSADISKQESSPETSTEFVRQPRAHRSLQVPWTRRIPNPGHARRASILRSPLLLLPSSSLLSFLSFFSHQCSIRIGSRFRSSFSPFRQPPMMGASGKLNKKPSRSLSAIGNHARVRCLSYYRIGDERDV